MLHSIVFLLGLAEAWKTYDQAKKHVSITWCHIAIFSHLAPEPVAIVSVFLKPLFDAHTLDVSVYEGLYPALLSIICISTTFHHLVLS